MSDAAELERDREEMAAEWAETERGSVTCPVTNTASRFCQRFTAC